MKKFLSVITAILLILPLVGCAAEPRFTDFDAYEADFTAVADFLEDYYTANGCSDRTTVEFSNGGMFLYNEFADSEDNTVLSAEGLNAAITSVENWGFDYAWVSQDCVVFWEDETKYYGLLYSQTPKHAIAALREWYSGMDTAKLSANWYEVGALNAI